MTDSSGAVVPAAVAAGLTFSGGSSGWEAADNPNPSTVRFPVALNGVWVHGSGRRGQGGVPRALAPSSALHTPT